MLLVKPPTKRFGFVERGTAAVCRWQAEKRGRGPMATSLS